MSPRRIAHLLCLSLLCAVTAAGCGPSDLVSSPADAAHSPDDVGTEADVGPGASAACAAVSALLCLDCEAETVLAAPMNSLRGPIRPLADQVYLLRDGALLRVMRDGASAPVVVHGSGGVTDFARTPTRLLMVESVEAGRRELISVAYLDEPGSGGGLPTFGQPITLLDGLGPGRTILAVSQERDALVLVDEGDEGTDGSSIFVRDVSTGESGRFPVSDPLPLVRHGAGITTWLEGGDATTLQAVEALGAGVGTVLRHEEIAPSAAAASTSRLFVLSDAEIWSAPLSPACPAGVCDAAAFGRGIPLASPPLEAAAQGEVVVWRDADAIRAWHPDCDEAVSLREGLPDAAGPMGLAVDSGEVFWIGEAGLMRIPAPEAEGR